MMMRFAAALKTYGKLYKYELWKSTKSQSTPFSNFAAIAVHYANEEKLASLRHSLR